MIGVQQVKEIVCECIKHGNWD